jgi:hypothetical protein
MNGDEAGPRFERRLSEVDPFAPFRLTEAGAEALSRARRIYRDEMLDEALRLSREAEDAARRPSD